MKTKSPPLTFFLAAVLVCLLNFQGQAMPLSEIIQANLKQRVEQGYSVGLVVGMIDKEGRQYYTYGTLSQKNPQKVDENTLYEIGSVSKTFTTLLLALMAEQELLQLDDPLVKWLPQSLQLSGEKSKQITLRQLANHTSGLPRMPHNFAPGDEDNPYLDYRSEKLYKFLEAHQFNDPEGAPVTYSNLGMGILGHVLALKSGLSYEQLMLQKIAQPLKMPDTVLTLSEAQKKRLARGHSRNGEVSNWDFSVLAGAGAIRSSGKDMLTYLAAQIGLEENPLQSAIATTHKTDIKKEIGLGWFVQQKLGSTIIWHNGGTGGYRSFVGFDKQTQKGVVVLSNSDIDADDIGFHILNQKYPLLKVKQTISLEPAVLDKYVGVYQLKPGLFFTISRESNHLLLGVTGQGDEPIYPESLSRFFSKGEEVSIEFKTEQTGKTLLLYVDGQTIKVPERKTVAVKAEILKQYEGRYQMQEGVFFTVSLKGGQLMVQLTGQPAVQVYPETESKFFYTVVDAQIEFKRGKNHEVQQLVLYQNGQTIPAKKMLLP